MSIIDILINETNYGGNKDKENKAISCSQLGSDPQECLMRYKHGVIDENKFGQNSIGSLVHMAIESIFKHRDDFKTELALSMPIYEDWLLTGTMDLFDVKNNTVYDIKVSKTYTLQKLKEEPRHNYKLQVNGYRMLLEDNGYKDVQMKILFINKEGGFNARKNEDIPSIEIVDVEYAENGYIEDMVKEYVNFIQMGKEKKCDDVWVRNVKGKSMPMKCFKYCSYNNLCTQYNPKPETVVKAWDF